MKWDVTAIFCKEPRVANMENSPSSPPALGQPQEIGKQVIKLHLLRKTVLETRLSIPEHDNGTAVLYMFIGRSSARHPPETGILRIFLVIMKCILVAKPFGSFTVFCFGNRQYFVDSALHFFLNISLTHSKRNDFLK